MSCDLSVKKGQIRRLKQVSEVCQQETIREAVRSHAPVLFRLSLAAAACARTCADAGGPSVPHFSSSWETIA